MYIYRGASGEKVDEVELADEEGAICLRGKDSRST
jgi:hypothetical protein